MKNNKNLLFKNNKRKYIATYDYNGFIVDLIQEDNVVGGWLRHKDYGVATYLFGIEISNGFNASNVITFFEDYLANCIEDHIDDYICDYAPELENE